MPRFAFLEGARQAGGTKTYSGAQVKQKTAVPQGAASLSLAVIESDGREREVAIDSEASWVMGKRTVPEMNNTAAARKRRVCPCKQDERGKRWLYARG